MEKQNTLKKKIVVISEANLTDKATGMAQTLANLFDNYPVNQLLFCSPQKTAGRFKKIKCIPYQGIFGNKFLKKIISHSAWDYWFKKIKLSFIIKKVLQFQPNVVLISNVDRYPCIIAESLLQRRKAILCIYLMDYIPKEDKYMFDSLINPLMKKANKHIFISKYMAEMCITEYPEIKNFAIIHNPVDEKQIAAVPVINRNDKEISFAYAGSLWQMHLDGVILFAKAIKKLKAKGYKIKFVIYTQPVFYNLNQQSFEDLEIVYGGFYNFNNLKQHLLKHSALLVASSFDKNFYDLSAYSVQTKVTDYLASGVPVIAIGPAYSACNKFIQENKCGFIIESSNVALIAEKIKTYLEEDANCIEERAAAGIKLMEEKYQKNFVQKELYSFLYN